MTDIPKLINAFADTRKARAWSQRELAAKLEMKQSQISDIEAGKRDVRISTFVEIARTLGLELVLVPRRLLPAVQYLLQSGEAASSQNQEETSMYESWKEED
jgi:transcriptional regulator with XRE-family HTH domain